MSVHTHYEEWQRLSKEENCPVCHAAPMPAGMVDIVELPHSWLSAEPVDCLHGACPLIAKKHAVEIFDLSKDELAGLMQEVAQCARALKVVTGARRDGSAEARGRSAKASIPLPPTVRNGGFSRPAPRHQPEWRFSPEQNAPLD